MFYSGIYTCGHEGRVQIYGPSKDRERKAQSEFNKMCRDCYIAQQRRAAWKRATEENLPVLQGTEKQIDWAMQIRERLLSNYEKETIPAQFAPAMEYVIEQMLHRQTAAHWWIDRRNLTYDAVRTVRDYMNDNPDILTEAKRLTEQNQEMKV